jgi:hypothetical protein
MVVCMGGADGLANTRQLVQRLLAEAELVESRSVDCCDALYLTECVRQLGEYHRAGVRWYGSRAGFRPVAAPAWSVPTY